MNIIGISEGFHDASASVISDGSIVFAGHAERYSKKKNDCSTNNYLLKDSVRRVLPDHVAYYEKPLLKKSRLILAGGNPGPNPYFEGTILGELPRTNVGHHYSHAAAGYYTSKFDDAVIVVLDAIGEWNTSTIWTGEQDNIELKYKKNYPVSFGLFYSAFTDLIGLMPNQEEYILMGMAGYGYESRYFDKINEYFPTIDKQKYNFHKGITDWDEHIGEQEQFDIAAAVQAVYELRLIEFMKYAKDLTGKKNLVFMGGCALNCSANTKLWDIFNDIWIMPNPGDSGSSLGAALAVHGKHVDFNTPYLGYDLPGKYPVDDIVKDILTNGISAVASGRAEFGPRALGNRSILADPRDPSIKDKVNAIKKREMFRPFAPVIMEDHASKWFDMDFVSPYMQYAVKCLKPHLVPSVVHVDGTSRVQTVNREQNPGLYRVLNKFYLKTGVPMLLNTSLNIKGQPLLNDERDIVMWEKQYNFKIRRSIEDVRS